jgi:hypothetical protein
MSRLVRNAEGNGSVTKAPPHSSNLRLAWRWLPPAHTMMTEAIRYSLSADCPEEDLQMRIPLRLQPVLIALTLLNLGILGVAIAREQAVAAPALTSDGILRGRGLQIVDDQGKVRASITINPAVKQPDGSTYLETVLLRMITSEGRPVVKISSSEDGAGMALSAAEGLAYVQILARGSDPKLVVVDGAGKETLKQP